MPQSEPNLLSFPSCPFNSIALALSGGGFRSACFSLGTLSYLNNIKISETNDERLIQRITYISSSSGGSITGALFAKYFAEGIFDGNSDKSFDKFYQKLVDFMDGDLLLENVFISLSKKNNQATKSKNLINAFSEVYDKHLFDGDTFDKLLSTPNKKSIDICLNTTEFATGLSFRFQTINGKFDSRGFGNHYVGINDESVAKKIKLSDILAASSCFPSGFEPMVFPNDFTHEKLTLEELKNAIRINPISNYVESNDTPPTWITEKKFGLMDGGVVDNQGLNSLLLASKRKREFDLIFVNDVSSHYMNSYEVPSEAKKSITYFLSPILVLLGIFVIIGLTFITYFLIENDFIKKLILYSGTGFLMGSLAVSIGTWKLVSYIFTGNIIQKKDKGSWDSVLSKYKNKFYTYRFSAISQMIRSRISSIFTLNNDVFLKQIRRLTNQKIFENPDWEFKRLSNLIFELSFTNEQSRSKRVGEEDDLATLLQPNVQMQRVAEQAYKMSTTLWFSQTEQNERKREAIIACGQFTTCYNLYKYILRLENGRKIIEQSEAEITISDESWQSVLYIKKQLEADWEEFLNNPYFLSKKTD